MTPNQRRQHFLESAVADRRYQFGQKHDSTTRGGSTACGHCSIQVLVRAWLGTTLTIDEVSRMAGYRYPDQGPDEGLRQSQVLRALGTAGLDYEGVKDADIDDVIEVVKHRGPALMLIDYRSYPEWLGYRYFGQTADGKPNGYARPLTKAGKNQLSGDAFGHWVLVLSSRYRPSRRSSDAYVRDPNHASSIRPQKSPYDIVTKDQLSRMLESYRLQADDQRSFVALPTRSYE